MDIGNDKHQRFIKEFIQSLHAGGDDSCGMQSGSRSLSESSLNPNAAEFVPSYLKSSDLDYDGAEVSRYQRKGPKYSNSSSTTLVGNEPDGDGLHITKEERLDRIQLQLHKLMNQLGNQSLPLLRVQFSLTSNGNGVNVQFMASENNKRQLLDKHLCETACLRLEVNEGGLISTRPEYDLARQFLERMGEIFNNKSQEKLPTICPKCTALSKKRSFTELEIDRQIEDIKAFEKLINEDEGARYQEAFKQLCVKLGLTRTNEQPEPELNAPIEVSPIKPEEVKNVDSEDELPCEADNLSTYEWDPFIPELTTMKVYSYSAPDASGLHPNEQKNLEQLLHPNDQKTLEQLLLKENYETNAPLPELRKPSAPNSSSAAYPKLYKISQSKWSNPQTVRKTNVPKEKDSKIQRWRFSSPAAPMSTKGAHEGPINFTAGTAASAGSAAKKPPERAPLNGNRIKRMYHSAIQTKSGLNEIRSSSAIKPIANCKLEPRTPFAKSEKKQQPENVHTNKPKKAATLPRAGAVVQAQGTKPSLTGTQRVVVPRSTHASQMRQSEVKRRLNLMRGDDTDVQYNEYLFK